MLMVRSESRFEGERWLGVSTTLLFKTGLPGHQFSVFAYNIVNPVLLGNILEAKNVQKKKTTFPDLGPLRVKIGRIFPVTFGSS